MTAEAADIERFVRYVVSSLVEHADVVEVDSKVEDEATVFEVKVHPDDVGKVIGRQGRIIKAIRVLARAAGSVDGRQIEVEILG